jgi:hypothetical protein
MRRLLLWVGLPLTTWAAPPVDFTQPDNPASTPRTRLTEKDITFVDSEARNAPRRVTMKFNVFARSLPKLDSKRLFRISPGTVLAAVQLSKDQKWMAVESIELKRKGWVPLKALEVPEGLIQSLSSSVKSDP